jgi:ectoine hydroxylase-related dioxygenase (phytanoyl-CoA dioxygenase family)
MHACSLTEEQRQRFWRDGYLGPLRCEAQGVGRLPELLYRAGVMNHGQDAPIPAPSTWHETPWEHINVHDPHLAVPEVMALCTHESVVRPVAQVLGCDEVAFFQSRFRVKFPHRADPVPWHQDIGENNGGYRADGTPVPSVTVWLSIDGASEASGSLRVIPGSHTQLFGDWRHGFHSRLEETGALAGVDPSRAVAIAADAHEFYLFHSWTLHLSTANTTASPRSGLVLRFVAPDDAVQPGTRYTILRPAAG